MAGLICVIIFSGTVIFLAVRAVPGDPVALRVKNPDPARVAAERARLGLDRPAIVQWADFLGSFARGEWGRSLASGRLVRDDMVQFMPATLELSMVGLALGTLIGVSAAVLAEVFEVAAFRRIASILGSLGVTVPIFWMGLLAIVAGSLWLRWFPSGGRFDLALQMPPVRSGFATIDALLAGDLAAFVSAINHLALPSLCLSLYPAAQVCTVLEARLRDQKLRSMIVALRARGFSAPRIWLGHVLRVVSAPVVTAIGSNFGTLLGGAVLTETVFSWPGAGRYVVEAVLGRDIHAVENVLLFIVVLVVCVVAASDFFAHAINPGAGAGDSRDEAL